MCGYGPGSVPGAWHNLNINDMGDNILRKAAEELKKAGCRVFAWQDDTYNRGWSKGDYTMLYYAFPDSPNIGYLSHGEYGMSVAYSRAIYRAVEVDRGVVSRRKLRLTLRRR